MRIFKTRAADKFFTAHRILDDRLVRAVMDLERWVVDASLGGGVFKQRIERSGGGKSGGFRTILVFRKGDIALFVYGFAKNERANIGRDELKQFKILAESAFAMSEIDRTTQVSNRRWQEVEYDGYQV